MAESQAFGSTEVKQVTEIKAGSKLWVNQSTQSHLSRQAATLSPPRWTVSVPAVSQANSPREAENLECLDKNFRRCTCSHLNYRVQNTLLLQAISFREVNPSPGHLFRSADLEDKRLVGGTIQEWDS